MEEKKTKKLIVKCISIIALITTIACALLMIFVQNVKRKQLQFSQEDLRAMSYNQITEDSSEFIQFNAFFARDLDNDGDAEKLDGTCKHINSKDMLYLDLNIINEGYLKNGKITINGSNFNYSMTMVKDDVLKKHYLSNDVTEIELNDVYAGTQKLIMGNIISDIGINTSNYSNNSTIVLTGTHVAEDGTETEINKTCNLTVDWYGNVSTSMYTYSSSYYYDNFSGNSISFSFYIDENARELLLKDAIATATIPEINGYAPTSVTTSDGTTGVYDEETRVFTMTRSSKINDDGVITSSLSRSNTFRVTATYPKEAFEKITSYTTITIPVTGKYLAYNNSSSEFENPISSNITSRDINVTFRETPPPPPPTPEYKYPCSFDTSITSKRYVYRPYYGYIISKQDLLNLYDNEEYKANFEYTVRWYADSGNRDKVKSFTMSETQTNTQNAYGDKFDQIVIDEYTTNNGIYFSNATTALGEKGTISVYNNDTNELIKVFTKEDWEKYNYNNPYKYDKPIKHIRVETTAPNENTTIYVYNKKELDAKKIVNDFTKEQIKNVSRIYTYLVGSADIEGSNKITSTKSDYAYYISEKTDVEISLSKTQTSTQETINEKIYINANASETYDAKWKNGEFIVEVPEEIVNMGINSVTTNNSNVKIVAYDLYKKDGKYLIKILTENTNLTTFRITIDCDITPDPRISTRSKSFKLYAYNEYCNEYYNTATDIYDVDGDNNITEQVGSASASLNLIAPMSLMTLETASDYNEEGEITIAPNVAETERETRQAKINITVTNNYSNTIDGVRILGKIPFKGNTYIINGKDMKSEFDTTITAEGIHISDKNAQDVKNKTVIYYSENENPTRDLTDISNGWMLTEDIKDFSKIKSYLIDIGDYKIQVGKSVEFDYNISIPENISFNLLSFATHAVYYRLNTESGNLSFVTEPNKIGVKVISRFDLEITKYKLNSNITIPGVTYNLKYKEKDTEGILQDKNRILTTNSEGKVLLENLYAETEYTLQEIKVPNTCELNANEINFKVNEDLSVTINGDVRNSELKEGKVLELEIEDEIKYNMQINKTKIGSDIPINNARFVAEDGNGNKFSGKTQNGGIAILEGLSLNTEYTLTETVAPANCELNEGIYKFKLVRNSDNEIQIQTIENSLVTGTPTVQDSSEILTPIVSLNVQDELRYTFDLTKQDLEGNNIDGVQFNIKGKGFSDEGINYVTSADGKLQIPGLYLNEIYTIEENKAIGYYLDNEKNNTIQFKASRVNGNLQITTWDVGDGILQNGTQSISEEGLTATLRTVLKNEKIPTYNLNIVKQNKDGELIQGAQFELTSLDTGIVQNITIGENGQGVFEGLYEYIEGKCITGEYTLEEIYAPEGYILDNTIMEFKAIRNEEGIVEIDIHSGDSILKVDEETNEKIISSDANSTTITVINKPIFNLIKYGDNNTLLPNTKFAITDLDGNSVTDVKGEIVGEEVQISGSTKHVLTTDENGKISANLPEGLYKAIEVEAPEGYELSANEADRTYYFGIGSSRPAQTSGEIDTIEWIKSVKSERISQFNDGVVTSDGGIIAVGMAENNIDIDGDGIADIIGNGTMDAIVVKYDSEGNIVWNKVIGGINDDELYGIAKVPTGGYIIAGYSSTSEVKYDNNLITAPNFGNEDGIIIKIDENGNYIWSQSLGGTKTDRINNVAVAQNGDIAVVGSFYGEMSVDNDSTETLTSHGGKDGFISVYTQDGTFKWAQSIGGTLEDYAKAVTATSNGFAVGVNFEGTTYVDNSGTTITSKGQVDGIVISYTADGTYSWNKLIGSTGNDIITDIILANDNQTEDQKDIVVVGSYAGNVDINADGTTDLSTRGSYDGMIVKLTESGNYVKALSVGGSSDDTISTIYQTSDGGLLFGGWYYGALTANIGGINKSISLSGACDGFIAKLNSEDVLDWIDGIKGTSYDEVTSVLQLSNSQYIAVGDFQSSTLNTMNKDIISSTSTFADAFVITYGETIIEPEIPQLQEINVVNNLSKYDITTEVASNGNGQREGGTITGDYNGKYLQANNKKFVENIKYGYSNTKDITITPNANYFIKEVTINGEVVNVNQDENGVAILPAGYFEDVTENKHIVVEFRDISEKLPQITVHHYLKDGDNYTTTKLADDEIIEGSPGESYVTAPNMNIENYTLERDQNGDYVIPDNASGTFTSEEVVVTYYYEEKATILTVHHYLEETENKLADDIVKEYKKQTNYVTTPSEEVLKDYDLVSVDRDEQGTITEDMIITYYYKKKVHNITTMVMPHQEQRTDALLNEKVSVEAYGGTITGEYTDDYKEEDNIKFVETVEQKENSVTEITVTPDEGYNIKSIKLISTADDNKLVTYNNELETDNNKIETVIFGTDASENAEISCIQNDDGSVTLGTFDSVTQNKCIQVEFEALEGKVITHHIIRGEDTDYQTSSKSDLVGEPYQTGEINVEHYKLVETSDNTSGIITKDDIDVYYYYDLENYNYSVHYFYDGIEDTTKVEKGLAQYEGQITEYTDKNITGYKLEKTNLPLDITDNAENNIINVYYVRDDFGYTVEHYYKNKTSGEYEIDNEATDTKTEKYNNTVEITDNDKKAKAGYEYEREEGTPLTITEIAENNVIKLYYGFGTYGYKVEHYYEDKTTHEYVIDNNVTDTKTAEYQDIITIEETDKKVKTGYEYERQESTPLTVTEVPENNVIKLYYGLADYEYKIEHYYEDKETHEYVIDNNVTDTKIAEYQDVITIEESDKKVKTGYGYMSQEGSPLTITEVKENNVIKLYYGFGTYGYKVEHYYEDKETHEYVIDAQETDIKTANYKDIITVDDINKKLKTGYEYESSQGAPLTITEVTENNVIKLYYGLADYEYTVHYFFNNIEDESKIERQSAEFGDKIMQCPDKVITGYGLEKTEHFPLIITADPKENVINVYYITEYKVTTEVIKHNENYKNGTVLTDIKGGQISGETEDSYENVLKGYMPKENIVITPSVTKDAEGNIIDEYEITKIIIKDGKDSTEETPVDFSNWLEKDGKVTIPVTELADKAIGMQSNKHIQVEFRKKTKVIVQYLEKETENVLFKTEDGIDYEEIIGHEGQNFETLLKPIQYYQSTAPYITKDEEKDTITSNEILTTDGRTKADGKMYADTLVIKYWYKKIPSSIAVRHIEINEQDRKNGLTLSSGKEIEQKIFTGPILTEQSTSRNEYTGYIAVNGPTSEDTDIVIATKDEKNKKLKYLYDKTLEVRYYYEKQYKVTTEVKPHTEKVEGKDKEVKGGNITIGGQNSSKTVLNRGDITDKVAIIPDKGYRIKSVTIQDVETNKDSNETVVKTEKVVPVSDVEKDNHNGELPKEYLQDIQSDKHIIVEYEKIPTKVIIEYKDADTKESILPNTEIEGFVNDKYTTQTKNKDMYVLSTQIPTNKEGIMTEKPITVTYLYKRQFYIKTSVKQSKDETIKGGTITGEDKDTFELVNRNENSKSKIVVTPDSKFKIKSITINNININIEGLVKADGTLELPVFEKMQENKNIVVEFERSMTNIKVQYLEKQTDLPLAEEEITEKYIGENYETNKKDIQYYKFVEVTGNAKGKAEKEETIVKYYYEKQVFNLKVDKWLQSININGATRNCQSYNNKEQIYKLEINRKIVTTASIKMTYKIRVTNVGEIEGYVEKLTEVIPTGFEFYQEDNEIIWTQDKGVLTTTDLKDKAIEKDSYKEIEIVLRWKQLENNFGARTNTVALSQVRNPANFADIDKDDNMAKSEMLIIISTGLDENSIVLIINMAQIVLAIVIAVVAYKKREK